MSIDTDHHDIDIETEVDDVNSGADVPATTDEPAATADDGNTSPRRRWRFALGGSVLRQAVAASVTAIVALAGVCGWLGWRVYQDDRTAHVHAEQLEVARQGALNLTTVDWQQADTDVARILDSATGSFYDDFSARAKPFTDVVKQAQSKSVGTVTAAGIESATDTSAQVLVAMSVQIANAGAAEQQPRSWRMRLTVEKVGEDVKVSNVEFVP